MEAMISIHAPREGGDADIVSAIHDVQVISIHAPREGGDLPHVDLQISAGRNFNPRPPRGGRPRRRWSPSPSMTRFQSTPPARGATAHESQRHTQHSISIHAPREGGDPLFPGRCPGRYISIHAPREGGDSEGYRNRHRRHNFNPRPPRGGRRKSYPSQDQY